MAITRTGSITQFTSTANSSTQGLTVAADAELLIVGISGYTSGEASLFSGGTLTVGGSPMTAVGCDANTGFMQGCLWYKFSPATGTPTLAWNWVGSSTLGYGGRFVYAAYKGVDTGGIRDSDGVQGNMPVSTKSLSCLSGDLIVAFGEEYHASGATASWTNVAEVQALTYTNIVSSSLAEGSPSGSTTVGLTFITAQDGGCAAIVVKPAGAGPSGRIFKLAGEGGGLAGPRRGLAA